MPGFDEIEFGSRRAVRRGPVDALFRRPSGMGQPPPGSGGDPGAESGRDGAGPGRRPRSGEENVELIPAGARRKKGSPKASRKKESRKKESRKKESKRRKPSGKRRPPAENTDDRQETRPAIETSGRDTTAGRQSPAREDAILVPLDQWTKVMNQLGNLHEAGQQLAEARERAARAETEAVFLRERLREMRAELHGRGGSSSPDVADG